MKAQVFMQVFLLVVLEAVPEAVLKAVLETALEAVLNTALLLFILITPSLSSHLTPIIRGWLLVHRLAQPSPAGSDRSNRHDWE